MMATSMAKAKSEPIPASKTTISGCPGFHCIGDEAPFYDGSSNCGGSCSSLPQSPDCTPPPTKFAR